METAQHWDSLAKNQPAEITMFQISEVQEDLAFNGRRSFLTLREFSQLVVRHVGIEYRKPTRPRVTPTQSTISQPHVPTAEALELELSFLQYWLQPE